MKKVVLMMAFVAFILGGSVNAQATKQTQPAAKPAKTEVKVEQKSTHHKETHHHSSGTKKEAKPTATK